MRRNEILGLAALCGLSLGCASIWPGDGSTLLPVEGAAVSQWRASTFTGSRQDQAAIDAGEDGTIFAVWASDRPRWGIYGQRFDRTGKAIGNETAISLWRPGMQAAPAVGAIPGGGAWVAWQSWAQDGDGGAIIARRFGRAFDGSSEILVNQDPQGDQRGPVVAVSPSGTAAFVWSVSADDGPAALRMRLFDSSGLPMTDESPVGDADGGPVRTPSIAAMPDGGFAVTYSLFDGASDPVGVRLQRFDARGREAGGPVIVSQAPGVEASVAWTAGGLVVAWLDPAIDGDDYGILARRLDAEGRPLGEPFVVNERAAGAQVGAAVAATGDGFAVAWNGPDAVLARAFDREGRPAGPEAVLAPGEAQMRVAAGTRRLASVGGRLVCAWSGQAPAEDDRKGDERQGSSDPDAATAVGVSMLAFDGFDGRGVRQGVEEDWAPALGPPRGAAEPHRPPTFDPKKVGGGRRQILNDGAGGFDAVLNTGWTPPDPHLAVGPSHIICMTNGAIRFFLKNGQQTFADEIEGPQGFWGGLGATGFVFDPETIYDGLSGRFFMMAAEGFEPGGTSHVLIAVSDDSDPNGTWFKYRFDTTAFAGDLFDSPNIGVTEDAVIITGDGFPNGPANYPVFIFDKASILAGNPPQIKKSMTMQTTTQSAGIPPVSYDSPPAVYFAEHKESNSNTKVRLIALTDSLTNPQFTSFEVAVPAYGPPIDPPQKGTGARVSTFDARFWRVAYRDGSLWATHHVNIGGRTLARWYEFRMNGWPKSGQSPELAQSGDIDPGPGIWTTFTGITADPAGAAAMVFNRSAADEPYTMATAYRLPCDPPGTFRAPESQKVTTGPYSQGRWGDYASVEPDPAVPGQFWAIHEYAINESWRAWIAPVMTLSCQADLNCDGTLDLFDFLAFTNLFNNKDPKTDCDGDGQFTLFDFLCFVNLFNAGC